MHTKLDGGLRGRGDRLVLGRRDFLRGGLLVIATPAIVRASSLMPLRGVLMPIDGLPRCCDADRHIPVIEDWEPWGWERWGKIPDDYVTILPSDDDELTPPQTPHLGDERITDVFATRFGGWQGDEFFEDRNHPKRTAVSVLLQRGATATAADLRRASRLPLMATARLGPSVRPSSPPRQAPMTNARGELNMIKITTVALLVSTSAFAANQVPDAIPRVSPKEDRRNNPIPACYQSGANQIDPGRSRQIDP